LHTGQQQPTLLGGFETEQRKLCHVYNTAWSRTWNKSNLWMKSNLTLFFLYHTQCFIFIWFVCSFTFCHFQWLFYCRRRDVDKIVCGIKQKDDAFSLWWHLSHATLFSAYIVNLIRSVWSWHRKPFHLNDSNPGSLQFKDKTKYFIFGFCAKECTTRRYYRFILKKSFIFLLDVCLIVGRRGGTMTFLFHSIRIKSGAIFKHQQESFINLSFWGRGVAGYKVE
jgi:hypothetical protein